MPPQHRPHSDAERALSSSANVKPTKAEVLCPAPSICPPVLTKDHAIYGGLDGKLIGTCKVENTGGWQDWKDVSCNVTGATGVQDLYLKFTGGAQPLLNLDHWRFE